jgi:hypothetical protein
MRRNLSCAVRSGKRHAGNDRIRPQVRVPNTFANMTALGGGKDVEMEEAVALLERLIAVSKEP